MDENLDISQRVALKKTIIENNSKRAELKSIRDALYISSGVYYAYAAAMNKKAFPHYKNWRNKLIRRFKKKAGIKPSRTIWDNMYSKNKRSKRLM